MCRKRNTAKTAKRRTTTTRSDAKRNENETPEIKRGARPIWAWLGHDPSSDPSVRSPPVRRPNLSRIGDAYFVWKIMTFCAAAKSIHIQNHRIVHLPRKVTSQDYEAVRMCSFFFIYIFIQYCFFLFSVLDFSVCFFSFLYYISLFFLFNLRIFLSGQSFLDYIFVSFHTFLSLHLFM